jgi:hypothetical protein
MSHTRLGEPASMADTRLPGAGLGRGGIAPATGIGRHSLPVPVGTTRSPTPSRPTTSSPRQSNIWYGSAVPAYDAEGLARLAQERSETRMGGEPMQSCAGRRQGATELGGVWSPTSAAVLRAMCASTGVQPGGLPPSRSGSSAPHARHRSFGALTGAHHRGGYAGVD